MHNSITISLHVDYVQIAILRIWRAAVEKAHREPILMVLRTEWGHLYTTTTEHISGWWKVLLKKSKAESADRVRRAGWGGCYFIGCYQYRPLTRTECWTKWGYPTDYLGASRRQFVQRLWCEILSGACEERQRGQAEWDERRNGAGRQIALGLVEGQETTGEFWE